MRRYIPLLALILLSSVVSAYVYKCEAGTEPTECRLWNLQYDTDIIAKHPDRIPIVNMPSTVRTVRLSYVWNYYNRKNYVIRYDAKLHSTVLRDPLVVEVRETRLTHVDIPTNLQLGDFRDNHISQIGTDTNKSYDLRYLDLSDNYLLNVANLTVLVRLQTLNLENNRLKELEPNIFSRMVNLTYLCLGKNHFATFDFHTVPKGVNALWLSHNELRELNLGGILLPALRELDLEANTLSSLDIAALFTAFPALEVVSISSNPLGNDEAERIIAELKRRNVSYYIGINREGDVDCNDDEYEIDGLCFTGSAMSRFSFWKVVNLLVAVSFVLGAFLFSVRWVWLQMRY